MEKNSCWKNYIILFLGLGITTGICELLQLLGVPETNIVVLYLLEVLLIARFTDGYLYGLLASVLSIVCFNFFFTSPYFTLSVDDPSYIVTFCIMMITSVVTSALTTKAKDLTRQAQERGRESQALYILSSRLADALEIEEILDIATETVGDLLQCKATANYIDEAGNIVVQREYTEAVSSKNEPVYESDKQRRRQKRQREQHFILQGQQRVYGMLILDATIEWLEQQNKMELLNSMVDNVTLALERFDATRARNQDREKMQRERERANMLRGISHDIRTPLSGIMGSSEMLLDMLEQEDSRRQLVQGIYQDAHGLKAMVENILSLTRLQDGKIVVHKEEESLEEIVGEAIRQVEKEYPARSILVEIPEDFRLVPMDAKLIGQVITNLLTNAVKHTTNEENIWVEYAYINGEAIVKVADEGVGIAPEDMDRLFQIFYTSKTHPVDVKKGIGLGLTICETIIKAHGGRIWAKNRDSGKGAEFYFALPLEGQGEEHE